MENILVVIGVIFSIIAFAIALGMIIRAITAENMKYSRRKQLLQNALIVLINGIGYWVIIGVMYAGCWLKLALDSIIK